METILSIEGKEKRFPMDLGIARFNKILEVLMKNNLKFIGVSNDKYKLNYIIIERQEDSVIYFL